MAWGKVDQSHLASIKNTLGRLLDQSRSGTNSLSTRNLFIAAALAGQMANEDSENIWSPELQAQRAIIIADITLEQINKVDQDKLKDRSESEEDDTSDINLDA